jgi:hypothetical protein
MNVPFMDERHLPIMHHYWIYFWHILNVEDLACSSCWSFPNREYSMLEVEMRIMKKATFNGLWIGVYTA